METKGRPMKTMRLSLIAIILLLIFTIACQKDSPSEPVPVSHKFTIYGDSRTGNDIHQQIVNQMQQREPEAVFHTGDMVEDGYNPQDWLTFDNITRDLQASTDFKPCLGNHENESPFYFAYFGIPESMRYYSVDKFCLHFVVLDSNWAIGVGSDQYNWLVNDLANSTGDFNVVLLHHPIYSVTREDTYYGELQAILVPVFQQNNVRIVFSGHEHNYERFYDAGIYYIVTGGGGAPLYDKTLDNPLLQVFQMLHHYCFATYDGESFAVKVYDDKDNMIDQFSFSVY
jgi:3',5'-cyclic AMP phosphodiesterase CpdA